MNETVQAKLAELRDKGRTLVNIARELELSPVTVESWNAGTRSPANPKSVLESLERLAKLKRIPKKRVYSKGSRKSKFTEENTYGDEAKTENLVGCVKLDKEVK